MYSDTPIQIVFASGLKLFLEGIRKILECESGINIVAETSNYEEAERCFTEIKPNFIFLDNTALELDVHRLLNLTTKNGHNTNFILFDNHNEDRSISQNVIYVNKEITSSELIQTIKRLDEGLTVKVHTSAEHGLTKMELRVTELIRVGLRNEQIARELSISEKTVKIHLNKIYRQLGLQNRYMLAEFSRKRKRRVR